MVTILLQTIIELLTGWKDSFFTWANEIGDKIAAIKTNSDSLPDIKSNTDDIKDNTAAVITPISNINTNVSAITPDVAAIKTDTAVIKNNANAIMTSAGQTAAFAEDIADNTLDCKNRLVTIGSDTTQIRADSGSMAADVAEIKNTLGLYLYNTIVTEDAEGSISNFDTDLKDYLKNAVVNIPVDANGISSIGVTNCSINIWDEQWEMGGFIFSNGQLNPSNDRFRNLHKIRVFPNKNYYFKAPNRMGIAFYKSDGTYLGYRDTIQNTVQGTPAGTDYIYFFCIGTSYANDISINCISDNTNYNAFTGQYQTVTFTSPITDGAEVDLLSGIVKINTSPITYDSITPIAIRTFKGVNNVYSDIGDMSVTYRETLKHYLEKQEGN